MIFAALRKAIAQLALGNLMEGWAAPETDLLCEAGLLPPDAHPNDRAVAGYCLPPSLSSYEIAERALWHAAKSLGEDSDGLDRETSASVPNADVLGILTTGDRGRQSVPVAQREKLYASHQPEPAHHKR